MTIPADAPYQPPSGDGGAPVLALCSDRESRHRALCSRAAAAAGSKQFVWSI